MLNLITLHRPHVTIQFCDGEQAFLLKGGATLSDLAERIDTLATAHGGWPQSIEIAFGPDKAQPVQINDQHSH